jgi:hypothetical protein
MSANFNFMSSRIILQQRILSVCDCNVPAILIIHKSVNFSIRNKHVCRRADDN